MTRKTYPVAGRRVIITGAARGIGAALARQLSAHGARVALLGLEADALAAVAADCAGAPWRYCDVGDRAQVETAIDSLVAELGGSDVLVANAGVARQLPIVGGDPDVFEQTLRVNLLGAYYCVRAAGSHLSHKNGYVLLMSSLAAAINLPLLGAYSASKAGVHAFGTTLRQELAHTGAKVGIAYFAELDTDMTSRGFDTAAAREALSARRWAARRCPDRRRSRPRSTGSSARSRVAPAESSHRCGSIRCSGSMCSCSGCWSSGWAASR